MSEIELTGCNEVVACPILDTWGWEVAAYLFLGGLVGGMMIAGAVLRMRRGQAFAERIRVADFVALPALGLGLLLLFADLANRWNAWRFFTTIQLSSPMSWGSWILLMAGVLLVLRLLVHLPGTQAPANLPRFVRAALRLGADVGERLAKRTVAVDVASILIGASLAFYTGMLLSTIPARPLWDSVALAPLFLVSGMTAGGAFFCLGANDDQKRTLAPATLSLCGLELGLIAAFIFTMASVTEAGQARELLVSGGFGVGFWLLVVGVGLLVPATIEAIELARRKVPGLLSKAAPYLKLTGAAALRFIVVVAGLQSFV